MLVLRSIFCCQKIFAKAAYSCIVMGQFASSLFFAQNHQSERICCPVAKYAGGEYCYSNTNWTQINFLMESWRAFHASYQQNKQSDNCHGPQVWGFINKTNACPGTTCLIAFQNSNPKRIHANTAATTTTRLPRAMGQDLCYDRHHWVVSVADNLDA